MAQTIKALKSGRCAAEVFDLYHQEKNAVLLDSSLTNDYGRFSIIGRNPYHSLKWDKALFINEEPVNGDFMGVLGDYLASHQMANPTALPLTAGGIGFFSYDFGRDLEKTATRHPREIEIPEAVFHFYDEFLIEDHQTDELWLIANGNLRDSAAAVREMEEAIAAVPLRLSRPKEDKPPKISPNFQKDQYLTAVKDMIRYIIEGDIYIANMTQHLTIESAKEPYAVFQTLRAINPSPFGGYLNYGDFQIISASPERFLSLKEGNVTTRPIKGTRKRGSTPQEDAALKEELLQSGKDQSELLMIVDLERNDLNKVCVPGSVEVTELFAVETYATVFHLVSTVIGTLRPQCNAADLLAATFPGGSITGAPKRRAMEIIDELEHCRRNIYTGSLGYIGLDGAMDMNIIIRTALHQRGRYTLGVGGGITFESDPQFEYEETLQKAKAVLEAIT